MLFDKFNLKLEIYDEMEDIKGINMERRGKAEMAAKIAKERRSVNKKLQEKEKSSSASSFRPDSWRSQATIRPAFLFFISIAVYYV